MKNQEEFRRMNCDDCVCNKCLGACMDCPRCYRAEYADEDWNDYYKQECEKDVD